MASGSNSILVGPPLNPCEGRECKGLQVLASVGSVTDLNVKFQTHDLKFKGLNENVPIMNIPYQYSSTPSTLSNPNMWNY